MAMAAMVRPRLVVEIGTQTGVSYCALCQSMARLGLAARAYAIRSTTTAAEAWRDLHHYHDPLYGGFSQLLATSADEAEGNFSEGSIDLLRFASHASGAARGLFRAWLPKLSERGVVLLAGLHAGGAQAEAGQLWEELKARFRSFEFSHQGGLGIVLTGRECPAELGRLLDAPEATRVQIQALYHNLGQRLSQRAAIDDIQQERTAELACARVEEGQRRRQEEAEREMWRQQERDRRRALQTRLAETEQWVQLHRAQLAEKELVVQTHSSENRRLMALEQTLQSELQRRVESERALEQTLLAEIRRLAANERLLYHETFRMGERDREVQAEIQRLLEGQRTHEQARTAEVQRLLASEDNLHRELDAIRRSASWRVARTLAKGMGMVAPPGSRRRRFFQLGRRGASVMRRQGLKALWRKSWAKLRGKW
jgi:hypothetical protein